MFAIDCPLLIAVLLSSREWTDLTAFENGFLWVLISGVICIIPFVWAPGSVMICYSAANCFFVKHYSYSMSVENGSVLKVL